MSSTSSSSLVHAALFVRKTARARSGSSPRPLSARWCCSGVPRCRSSGWGSSTPRSRGLAGALRRPRRSSGHASGEGSEEGSLARSRARPLAAGRGPRGRAARRRAGGARLPARLRAGRVPRVVRAQPDGDGAGAERRSASRPALWAIAEAHTDWARFALHGVFIVLFGALNVVFTRAEIARVRERSKQELDEEKREGPRGGAALPPGRRAERESRRAQRGQGLPLEPRAGARRALPRARPAQAHPRPAHLRAL